MKKVGRNDPCHCGSGKKYKNCHQQIDDKRAAQNYKPIIAGAFLIILIVVAIIIYLNTGAAENDARVNAPPGKVWSEEHGHWHDAE